MFSHSCTLSVWHLTHRVQSAGEAWELAVATVTAEVSLSVELIELVSLVTVQGAGKTHTSHLIPTTHTRATGIQCLTIHIALSMGGGGIS